MPSEKENPENMIKIKIIKNGPYLVSGGVPLSERIIMPNGRVNELQPGREYPDQQDYALCRCGRTGSQPYCDGSHERNGFCGTETADRADYATRAELLEGPGLDLLDDHRCALAHFCYRNGSDAWEMTEKSDDPKLREEAIKAAIDCPAGRLTVYDKAGNPIEPEYKPSIAILQDEAMGISGPIFVMGGVPIESEDGFTYEVRNRATLCRCGQSTDMPFCDGSHAASLYRDRTKR